MTTSTSPPKSHRPLGSKALERRLAAVPDTRLADDDRRTRDRVLLVALVAGAVVVIVLVQLLTRGEEQAVVERDVAVSTSLDLATQVQEACAAGELTGRLCDRAADVAADPVPGLPGEVGQPGSPGRDGQDGVDGAPGAVGQPGVSGTPGQPGSAGAQGSPGVAGQDGRDGQDGADGQDGRDGAAGPRPVSAEFAGSPASCLYRIRYDDGVVLDAVAPGAFCGGPTDSAPAPLPEALGAFGRFR